MLPLGGGAAAFLPAGAPFCRDADRLAALRTLDGLASRAIWRVNDAFARPTADFYWHAALSPRPKIPSLQFINSRNDCTSRSADRRHSSRELYAASSAVRPPSWLDRRPQCEQTEPRDRDG